VSGTRGETAERGSDLEWGGRSGGRKGVAEWVGSGGGGGGEE